LIIQYVTIFAEEFSSVTNYWLLP